MSQVSVTAQVADHIRRFRTERRWSARQLAEACARAGMTSLTRSTISKIESGARKSISVDELATLCEVLEVSADVLVGSPASSSATTALVKQATNLVETSRSFLDEPVESASYDVGSIQQFRSQMRSDIVNKLGPGLTPQEFLTRAHLWADNKLTRTGALLFAEDPSIVCPAAIVRCTRYFGKDRAVPRESLEIERTVPEQIVASRDFVADRAFRDATNEAGQGLGIRPYGEPEYDYPMIAVREVIANSLVHRDYKIADSCIHVRLFSDRLEVASPGDWYGRNLTDGEEYSLADLAGQSRRRNFRLAQALFWIRLVEGEGSGIPVMIRDCESMPAPVPTVVQQDGFVTVTLRPRNNTAISAD